jgi:hypothetical protein
MLRVGLMLFGEGLMKLIKARRKLDRVCLRLDRV